MAVNEELKVLTLNTWGLHFIAKRIRERFEHISDELSAYDIVCLQEVWSDNDYEFLRDSVRSDLPYSSHYPSGIIGSGLVILSRYPIINVFSHEYRVTHTIKDFTNGERFARKGVLACRIEMPLGHGHVTVFNTHINPAYRDNQFIELMQFMSNVSSNNGPVILCGDFNTGPTDNGYKLITQVIGLTDSFIDDPQPTCNLPHNCYTKSADHSPCRLDYIFFTSQSYDNNCSLHLKSHSLALSGNIPGKTFPYSDHEGLEVVYNIIPPKSVYTKRLLTDEHLNTLTEMNAVINTQLTPIHRMYGSRNTHLALLWLLLAITSLTVSVLMILPAVYNALSAVYLQLLCSLIPAIFWVGSILIFFYTLDSVHIMRSMKANHNHLKIIIDHHRKRTY